MASIPGKLHDAALLAQAGANIAAVDEVSQQRSAVFQNMFQIQNMVHERTSCTFVPKQEGKSCLYFACENGHLELVKYFCENFGETLLMLQNYVSCMLDCQLLLT
jgi:hypothetical protein